MLSLRRDLGTQSTAHTHSLVQRVDAVEAVVGERLAGALDGATQGHGGSWKKPFYFLVLVDIVALAFVGANFFCLACIHGHAQRLASPTDHAGTWVSKFRKAALL